MCRILAITSLEKIDKNITNFLKKFRRLAHTGDVSMSANNGHKDGWGIAGYKNHQLVFIKKECGDAFASSKYEKVIGKIILSNPSLIIAHLRKSSIGEKNIYNTHPFIKNNYLFCHNGTIFNKEKITFDFEKYKNIKGTTDSEKFFLYVLDIIKNRRFKTAGELRGAIKKSVHFARKKLNYTALNFIFSNGKFLIYNLYYSQFKMSYINNLSIN